jgi:hypothetical protein
MKEAPKTHGAFVASKGFQQKTGKLSRAALFGAGSVGNL